MYIYIYIHISYCLFPFLLPVTITANHKEEDYAVCAKSARSVVFPSTQLGCSSSVASDRQQKVTLTGKGAIGCVWVASARYLGNIWQHGLSYNINQISPMLYHAYMYISYITYGRRLGDTGEASPRSIPEGSHKTAGNSHEAPRGRPSS